MAQSDVPDDTERLSILGLNAAPDSDVGGTNNPDDGRRICLDLEEYCLSGLAKMSSGSATVQFKNQAIRFKPSR